MSTTPNTAMDELTLKLKALLSNPKIAKKVAEFAASASASSTKPTTSTKALSSIAQGIRENTTSEQRGNKGDRRKFSNKNKKKQDKPPYYRIIKGGCSLCGAVTTERFVMRYETHDFNGKQLKQAGYSGHKIVAILHTAEQLGEKWASPKYASQIRTTNEYFVRESCDCCESRLLMKSKPELISALLKAKQPNFFKTEIQRDYLAMAIDLRSTFKSEVAFIPAQSAPSSLVDLNLIQQGEKGYVVIND